MTSGTYLPKCLLDPIWEEARKLLDQIYRETDANCFDIDATLATFQLGKSELEKSVAPIADHNRIKCIICGQHKNHEHFSKNELKSISWKRNAKELRCQACNSGQQRLELECERCGKVKDNSKFSKASRRNGGNKVCTCYATFVPTWLNIKKWCIDCTIYKEAAAPHHIDDNLVADSWETEINDSMSAITIMPTLRSSVAESSIVGAFSLRVLLNLIKYIDERAS